MSVTCMEILHDERAGQRTLGLDKATRDALAAYCRLQWPQHTAKSAARAWGLTLDEGRGLVAGRASQATVDKIWKHPDGGWSVALPVIGAVIGQPVHSFFRQQIRDAAKAAEHAEQHERLAQQAYRALEADAAPPGEDRRTWKGSGEMGADQTRRLARRQG